MQSSLFSDRLMNMVITSAQFILSVVGSHNLPQDGKQQIAFIGRSNVGKSSVINMLVGQNSLVHSSSTPGKTRQINFFLINDEIYFVDLPGYGYAKHSAKKREKLRKLILWYFISKEANPVMTVLIVDARAGLRDFDREMIAVLDEYDCPHVVVANKIDKLNQSQSHHSLKGISDEVGENVPVIPLSAKSGRGRDQLLAKIL